MSNCGRDGVTSHQPYLALTTLSMDRAKQPRIKRRYLVKQDNEDDAAGQECNRPDGIPAIAEVDRGRIIAEWHIDRVKEHHDHQPKIECRASSDPEHDERANTKRTVWTPHNIRIQ